jgi:hypothetical protein
MSKKSKTTKVATPKGYENLALPTKTVGGRKIVITPDRGIVVLPGKGSKVPPGIDIDIEFEDMDDFLKRGRGTAMAYHAEFLKFEADPKTNWEEAAMYVWAYFVKNGKPILEGQDAEGKKERKSTIGQTLYRRGTETSCAVHTPQAKACFALFERCIEQRESVKEEELRAFVEAHATELHTKQDPWRIFQYYRPQLMKAHLITRQ